MDEPPLAERCPQTTESTESATAAAGDRRDSQVSAAAELRIWCFHLARMKGGLGHGLVRCSIAATDNGLLLFGLWKRNNATARYMIWVGPVASCYISAVSCNVTCIF